MPNEYPEDVRILFDLKPGYQFFFSPQLLSYLSYSYFINISKIWSQNLRKTLNHLMTRSLSIYLSLWSRWLSIRWYLPLLDPLNTRRGADHERGGHASRRGYHGPPQNRPSCTRVIRFGLGVSQLCTRRESRTYNGADIAVCDVCVRTYVRAYVRARVCVCVYHDSRTIATYGRIHEPGSPRNADSHGVV